MKKLNSVLKILDIIHDISLLDCNAIVCDSQCVILKFIQAETFKANFRVGSLASAGAIKEVISTRKPLRRIIPGSVYGVKLKASMIPVIEDNGILSGVFGTATNMETQNELYTAAHSIAITSGEISTTSGELAASALLLASSLIKAKDEIGNVIHEIGKTEDILKFVDDVADSSNLLGLNAAIESLRAGGQGQGFRVVADKIREMAKKSSGSVRNIRNIINTIQDDTNNLLGMITKVSELGQQQAESTEEIESAMKELANSAWKVEVIAEKM